MKPVSIRARDWFYESTEMYEKNWDRTIESIEQRTGETFDGGSFQQLTITELKRLCGNAMQPDADSNDVLPLYVLMRKRSDNIERFDTSALQVAAQPGTLFQVASNFNCLELGSYLIDPFKEEYLTKLMVDTTQGPSASAGAGRGAILRIAEHKRQPIDLLSETPLTHVNGKLYECDFDGELNPDLIKIGLHTNVKATFERAVRGTCTYHPNGPAIDQVFTSTIILDINATDKHLALAEVLLTQAYVGTYLAAIHRQSPRVVLTLIGGHAFKNPLKLIVRAMATAHNALSKYLAPNCRVELPVYEPCGRDDNLLKILQKEIPTVKSKII